MLLQTVDDVGLVEFPNGGVGLLYGSGDADAELMTGVLRRHAADISGNDMHSILAVAHKRMEATFGFRSGSVDNGNEITCDDETVLAFLLGVLRYEALLDNIHCYCIVS